MAAVIFILLVIVSLNGVIIKATQNNDHVIGKGEGDEDQHKVEDVSENTESDSTEIRSEQAAAKTASKQKKIEDDENMATNEQHDDIMKVLVTNMIDSLNTDIYDSDKQRVVLGWDENGHFHGKRSQVKDAVLAYEATCISEAVRVELRQAFTRNGVRFATVAVIVRKHSQAVLTWPFARQADVSILISGLRESHVRKHPLFLESLESINLSEQGKQQSTIPAPEPLTSNANRLPGKKRSNEEPVNVHYEL